MLKKLIEKIRDSKLYTSQWIVLAIDVFIVLQTFILANVLYYNFKIYLFSSFLFYQLPFIALFSLISFLIIGSYKGIVRHTSIDDAYNILKAVTIMVFFTAIFVYIFRNTNDFKRLKPYIPHSISILFIHYILNIVVLIVSRFLFKRIYERLILGYNPKINILIYGAGDSGLITYSTIKNDKNNRYNIIGFIDDNPSKIDKQFYGKKCFSSTVLSDNFIEKYKIKEIIISIQNIEASKLLSITDKLMQLPVQVKIVPPVSQWLHGNLNIKQIKEIKIEDLLNRKPIQVNNPVLNNEFLDKNILITGAAGSIGSEITKQITNYKYKNLYLLDQAESPLYDLQQDLKQNETHNFKVIISDIRNKTRMENVFKNNKIDIVFHAAAYKHVPLMEDNPYEAVCVNVLGTKNIMDLSDTYKVKKFVMVSTDKAVNPTNVMGATKRTAEIYAKYLQNTSKTKFIITRFGNVLGSNGSVIPLFKKQIKQGGPLTVTHKEITRYFMTIPEACQLVLEAGAMGKGGEIFVFDMGKSVKIFDLAKKMIRLSGFNYPNDINIEIVGLRPGEKLFEELLSNSENTQPTYHKKILIAKEENLNYINLGTKINKLTTIQTNYNEKEIVEQIKTIVSEYISKNSKFEVLD